MNLVASTKSASPRTGAASVLTLAGIAALLASACCVFPLVFVFVGVSGAWIGQLQRFETYSPWLTGLALASLGIAAARLFLAHPACALHPVAACGMVNAVARRWFWIVALLTALPVVVPLMAPLFY